MMEPYQANGSDCMFFTQTFDDGVIVCQLCIRQSSSASAAQGWLKGEYEVSVEFRLKHSWYCALWVLPVGDAKTDELIAKLTQRCTVAR
jgi:hypothetical protein